MNSQRRLRAPSAGLLILAAIPLALSACGGSGSGTTSSSSSAAAAANGKQKGGSGGSSFAPFGHQASASQAAPIEAAFNAYLGALADGNWSHACSRLTATARRRKARNASLLGAESHSCATALEAATETLTATQRAALTKAEPSAVRIQGDGAYVLYEAGGAEAAMLARNEAGEWKLDGSFPSFKASKQSTTNDHSNEGAAK